MFGQRPIDPQDRPSARHGRRRGTAAVLLAAGAAAALAVTGLPAHAAPAPVHTAAFTTVKAPWTTGAAGVTAASTTGLTAKAANEASARYWTAERMRKAEPDTMVRTGSRPAGTAKPAARPAGKPGSTRPVPAVPAEAARALGRASPRVGVPLSATVGKVYYHNPVTNQDSVCSASTIGSPSMMLVMTAAHCIHTGAGGTWMTNWTFVPRYTNGARPYGTWAAKYYTAFSEWQTSSNHDRDLGFVTMWPNLAGQRIVDVVGGNGLAWNQSYEQVISMLGYPAEAPFTGETQQSSSGSTFRLGVWPFQENTVATWCNLNGGASGGPWLPNYSGGVGLVNGVISTRDATGICRSPYFDDAVHSMFVNIGSAV